jgi:hypothetical protein
MDNPMGEGKIEGLPKIQLRNTEKGGNGRIKISAQTIMVIWTIVDYPLGFWRRAKRKLHCAIQRGRKWESEENKFTAQRIISFIIQPFLLGNWGTGIFLTKSLNIIIQNDLWSDDK